MRGLLRYRSQRHRLLPAGEESDIAVRRTAVLSVVADDLIHKIGFAHHGWELQVLFTAASADNDGRACVAILAVQVKDLTIGLDAGILIAYMVIHCHAAVYIGDGHSDGQFIRGLITIESIDRFLNIYHERSWRRDLRWAGYRGGLNILSGWLGGLRRLGRR